MSAATSAGSGDTVDYAEMLRHYNGYDPETSQRYVEVTDWARTHCPVAHTDSYGGYWIVSTNAEIREVLSDTATFSSRDGTQIPVEQRLRKPPQDMDPPIQTDFRRLLNRHFSLRGLTRFRPGLEAIAAAQAEALLPGDGRTAGSFEAVADLARPMTTQVLCRVIFDLDDPESYREIATVAAGIATGSAEASARAFVRLQELVNELLDSLTGRDRRDDVLDAVLYGTVLDRPLTRDEQIGTLLQLLLGGLKTTVSAITNILFHLTQHPGLEDELRTPEWSRRYLDEFLRLDAPAKMVARRVLRDTVVGGQPIPAGDMVAVMLGSANRDESVFVDSTEICPDRPKNPHISFGLGVHRCIGSNLARVEIVTAIDALLARVRDIRLADGFSPRRVASNPELAWESMELQFSVA